MQPDLGQPRPKLAATGDEEAEAALLAQGGFACCGRLRPPWWKEMLGSVTSVFSEPGDFGCAAGREPTPGLLMTPRCAGSWRY